MTTQQQLNWSELITKALTSPGNLGNTFSRFYDYSFTNQMYLWFQGVHEPVATYKKWLELGRQVKKGSKAKMIVRPIFVKTKEKDPTTGKITEEFKVVGFKPINCIFTLGDTDGEELPPVEAPEWKLEQALETLEIKKVKFSKINGNIQGYAKDRELAINPLASDPLKTAIHEIAHIVCGHTAEVVTDTERTERSIREFQAEATAYLVMNELQITDKKQSESRAYIQHWLEDQKPTDAEIRKVFKATDEILKSGKVELDQATNKVAA